MKPAFRLLLTLLVLAGILMAALPAKEEAPKTKRIKVSNVVELREHVSKRVTIYGTIDSTGMASGHNFLNFYGKQVAVFCHRNDVAKFKDGKPAVLFKGKIVEVTGELALHKGKLQLRLTGPSDIKVIGASAVPSPKPPQPKLTKAVHGIKPIELKQTGKELWVSPAGLHYQGRDPQGHTRVEHVMRHVTDQPNRRGPHGVFDGGKGVAFGVIDEAWRLAHKKRLAAEEEGTRSKYTVLMDYRVGYLGGTLGKSKGHPPLKSVFIVFETGTTNIITAFPR